MEAVGRKVMHAPIQLKMCELLAVSSEISNYIHDQMRITASFILPLFVIKGSSSPVDINLILPDSLNPTTFALRASVNSVQSLRVCSTLSHHMHLRCHGRSEFVEGGPDERGADCWRGCGWPSKNSVSFVICRVSSSIESEADGTGLVTAVGTV